MSNFIKKANGDVGRPAFIFQVCLTENVEFVSKRLGRNAGNLSQFLYPGSDVFDFFRHIGIPPKNNFLEFVFQTCSQQVNIGRIFTVGGTAKQVTNLLFLILSSCN